MKDSGMRNIIVASLMLIIFAIMIVCMCSCECVPEKGRDDSFIKGHQRPEEPELKCKIGFATRMRQ